MNTIFITGIGTGIGKTFISALLAKALNADYWKPIQAGLENKDADFVKRFATNETIVHQEVYVLEQASSPHLAAKAENKTIDIEQIICQYDEIRKQMPPTKLLIIEGVGGLLSPINNEEQNIHLIKKLNVPVIIISQNYLGSINHSLLTHQVLKINKCKVIGWIFNGQDMHYEEDIIVWSNVPKIISIRNVEDINLIPDSFLKEMSIAFNMHKNVHLL